MVSRIFSVLFIFILFYFIIRSLLLMKQEEGVVFQEAPVKRAPEWGLSVLDTTEDSVLQPGTLIPLTGDFTIGRNSDNQVILEDSFISSYHAHFFSYEGRYVIEDLNSTNGTLLNGDRLEESTYLEINDIITLGANVFRVVQTGRNHG